MSQIARKRKPGDLQHGIEQNLALISATQQGDIDVGELACRAVVAGLRLQPGIFIIRLLLHGIAEKAEHGNGGQSLQNIPPTDPFTRLFSGNSLLAGRVLFVLFAHPLFSCGSFRCRTAFSS